MLKKSNKALYLLSLCVGMAHSMETHEPLPPVSIIAKRFNKNDHAEIKKSLEEAKEKNQLLHLNVEWQCLKGSFTDLRTISDFLDQVQVLRIMNNDLGDQLYYYKHLDFADRISFSYFSEKLKSNKTMTLLNLSGNNLSCDEIEDLMIALQQNKKLETLFLRTNEINAEGCKIIANMLIHNTTLKELDIGNNFIHREGAQFLSKALTINSTLNRLVLSNTNVPFDMRQQLVENSKGRITFQSPEY